MTTPRHWLHLLLVLSLALQPTQLCAGSIDPTDGVAPTGGCASQTDCCCGPDGAEQAGPIEADAQSADCSCSVPQPIHPGSPSSPVTTFGAELFEVLDSPLQLTTLEFQTDQGRSSARASTRLGLPARHAYCVRLL
jgi:hypothetical protein